MKHILFTAPIATGLLLLAGAGIATADVITSNDAEDAQITTNEGTSNDSEPHMVLNAPGIVDTPGTSGTLQVVGQRPVLDDDGNPVLDEDGKPVTRNVWGWVPFNTPNTLVIIHNP
ncbi:MAG: hypothetical protein EOO27_14045 [Comamonadaceae bacterium]|nr:MAG: hypothetical protein EOO27_14045 [Comamonadaceae bacterium]